jgi:hypothetical protein
LNVLKSLVKSLLKLLLPEQAEGRQTGDASRAKACDHKEAGEGGQGNSRAEKDDCDNYENECALH